MVIEILKTHQLNKAVNDNNKILVGKFKNISWIRCEGKGSFSNSPRMKQWAESHIDAGGNGIVIDSPEPSSTDNVEHVFDAHKLLCEADENNDEKFSTVLDVLEAELKNRSNQN